MVEHISVAEAAGLLNVHESRVRALVDQGGLPARKIGRDLVLERTHVLAYGERRRGAGRPLPASNAWAILALLSGSRPEWVPRSSLYRLRKQMHDRTWVVRSLEHSAPRARVHEWQLLRSDVRHLLDERPGVQTGTLAAPRYSQLVPSQRLEYDAYVDERTLRRLVDRFRPVVGAPRLKRNVTLRVPSNEWILAHEPTAPAPVVAADLLLDPGERVRRAGRELLERATDDD